MNFSELTSVSALFFPYSIYYYDGRKSKKAISYSLKGKKASTAKYEQRRRADAPAMVPSRLEVAVMTPPSHPSMSGSDFTEGNCFSFLVSS